MNTKVISIITSAFILLVSFQNCQKPPYPDEINGSNVNLSLDKLDLSKEDMLSINFVVASTKSVNQTGNTYQINYNKTLLIDLKSGLIKEGSDLSNVISRYCLPEDMKIELLNILVSSQVCTSQSALPQGVVCTQVMKMPYAQLTTARIQFDLGAATDGCGSNSIDLCEVQAGILKAYIEAVKSQYQQMTCPTSI